MKHFIKLSILVLLSHSCATKKGADFPIIVTSANMQQAVIGNDLFFKILREMEEEKSIDWSKNRLSSVSAEELAGYDNNASWLIDKYQTKGVYSIDEIFVWRKFNPFSPTTAVTSKCINTTKLNQRKLDRTKYSVLNTLIHERVHSFCTGHPSQKRKGNECDPAYVAGDLAQILTMYRDNQDLSMFKKKLCPGLESKLIAYNILKPTNE
jgi:hypothetical protein